MNPDIRATSLADKHITKDGKPRLRVVTATEPLDRVEEYLRRFVVYPNEHASAVHALWIAHTHLMDCWDTTPRLAFMSNGPGSGKTRALEVSELLVLSPKMSASMSAAALVRIIAKARKDEDRYLTILYDEIDGVFSKSEEGTADLRSALNSGYRRNGMLKTQTPRSVDPVETDLDINSIGPLVRNRLRPSKSSQKRHRLTLEMLIDAEDWKTVRQILAAHPHLRAEYTDSLP